MLRHQLYASNLSAKLGESAEIIVITNSPGEPVGDYSKVKIKNSNYRTLTTFLFWIRIIQVSCQLDITKILFVASDPKLSFLNARISQIVFLFSHRVRIPIQLQLHGDFACQINRGFYEKLERILLKCSLSNSQQVRFVSEPQYADLRNRFMIGTNDILIAPVPLHINGVVTRRIRTNREVKTIGFVGRIQKERGLSEFVKFIETYFFYNKDFTVVVVGDGPDRSEFLAAISTVVSKDRVSFLGFQENQALLDAYMKIDLLVNTAPSEAYGRTMREALICGCKVAAITSNGALDLSKQVGPGDFYIYSSKTSGEEMIRDLNELMSTPQKDYQQFFKELDVKSINLLTSSWKRLLGNGPS